MISIIASLIKHGRINFALFNALVKFLELKEIGLLTVALLACSALKITRHYCIFLEILLNANGPICGSLRQLIERENSWMMTII